MANTHCSVDGGCHQHYPNGFFQILGSQFFVPVFNTIGNDNNSSNNLTKRQKQA